MIGLRLLRKLLKEEHGVVVVLVSLSMVVLLGSVALVTDFGLLLLNKQRLSNACDAAALAGAQELPNQINAANIAGVYLQKNGVSSEDAEISFPRVNDTTTIQVSAISSVDYIFAKILGHISGTVNASSQSALGGVTSAKGIVPFSIPDQTLQFGVEYTLKEGGGSGSQGNYGALALGGRGASNYRYNIKNGYTEHISVGDWVDTETGNMSGPTSDGINYRMNQCTYNCTSDNFQLDCPRVVTVPIYDPNTLGNGRTQIKIVGFALFLLNGVDGHGNKSVVHGYFLNSVPPSSSNASTEPGQRDYGLHITRLIK